MYTLWADTPVEEYHLIYVTLETENKMVAEASGLTTVWSI